MANEAKPQCSDCPNACHEPYTCNDWAAMGGDGAKPLTDELFPPSYVCTKCGWCGDEASRRTEHPRWQFTDRIDGGGCRYEPIDVNARAREVVEKLQAELGAARDLLRRIRDVLDIATDAEILPQLKIEGDGFADEISRADDLQRQVRIAARELLDEQTRSQLLFERMHDEAEELKAENAELKTAHGLMSDDIARALRALGISDHARDASPHEVMTMEVVPAIGRLVGDLAAANEQLAAEMNRRRVCLCQFCPDGCGRLAMADTEPACCASCYNGEHVVSERQLAAANERLSKLVHDLQAISDEHANCDGYCQLVVELKDRLAQLEAPRSGATKDSCEHCGAVLLPKRKEPLLCIDCVAVCSDDCDHRWPDQPTGAA